MAFVIFFKGAHTLRTEKVKSVCWGHNKIWGSRERGGVQHAHSRLPLSLKKYDVEDYTFSVLFYLKKKTKFVRFVRSKNPPIFLPSCMSVPFLSIVGHASSLRHKTKGLSLPHLLLLQQNLLLLLLLLSLPYGLPTKRKTKRSNVV